MTNSREVILKLQTLEDLEMTMKELEKMKPAYDIYFVKIRKDPTGSLDMLKGRPYFH